MIDTLYDMTTHEIPRILILLFVYHIHTQLQIISTTALINHVFKAKLEIKSKLVIWI